MAGFYYLAFKNLSFLHSQGHTIVMLRAAEMPWRQNESLQTGEVSAEAARSLFCLFLFLKPSSRPPYNGSRGSGYLGVVDTGEWSLCIHGVVGIHNSIFSSIVSLKSVRRVHCR